VATAFADTTWPKPTQMAAITVYAFAFLAADINDATVTAVCLGRLVGGTRNQNNSSPASKGLTFTKIGICIEVSVPTEAVFFSRWRTTATYTTTTAAHLPKVLCHHYVTDERVHRSPHLAVYCNALQVLKGIRL
jgi:hypothetical protein